MYISETINLEKLLEWISRNSIEQLRITNLTVEFETTNKPSDWEDSSNITMHLGVKK